MEIAVAMRLVAEGHILALTASAKRNPGSAVEVKFSPVLVEQLKIPLNLDAAIRFNNDFRRHGHPSCTEVTRSP